MKYFEYDSLFLLREDGISHNFLGRAIEPAAKNIEPPSTTAENLRLQDSIRTCKQVHSTKVLTLLDSQTDISQIEADAITTNIPGITLSVRTADCAPVLFFDPQANIIAAAHAGWKGALGGILENTVLAMQEIGAKAQNIIAAIGPCIQQKSYEVDSGFRELFLARNDINNIFFLPSKRKGHYMFDLPGFCLDKLRAVGVSKVENLGIDTYSNIDTLYSFRYAKHNNLLDIIHLRQFSTICIHYNRHCLRKDLHNLGESPKKKNILR